MDIKFSYHPTESEIKMSVTLYESAFPQEERRPTAEWLNYIREKDAFTLHVIKESHTNQFLGFITTWDFSDFVYVEHFAIIPPLWGFGFGSMAFKEILQKAGNKPLVLEVEPPTDFQAYRRIQFYERLGMHLMPFPYQQPSYASELPPIPLQLMCNQDLQDEATWSHMIHTIHQQVYGKND